jgi:hypothetical protein
MRTDIRLFSACLFMSLFLATQAFSDMLVFKDGHSVSGTIIQTNNDTLLLLANGGAFSYSTSSIKEVRSDQWLATTVSNDARLPCLYSAILFVSKQTWATNLSPIPATVIDQGVLKNVPYSSFRCGADYEINIYGDPEHPAGIEIGVYRKLLGDPVAKTNCLAFISGVLGKSSDKDMVWSLNRKTDYKTLDDLTFEITPPNEMDSYGGWWVSVYSEQNLFRERATDAEMQRISIAKADVSKQSNGTDAASGWSLNDLKAARESARIIQFVNSSGDLVTNAAVIRVIDGVSLIYSNGPTSGGMVRLADLPADLQREFGYDAAKTAAADELAKARKAQWQAQLAAAQQAAASAQNANVYDSGYSGYGSDSDGNYSAGRVYVHGYYRANGTYVQPYTRRYPSR